MQHEELLAAFRDFLSQLQESNKTIDPDVQRLPIVNQAGSMTISKTKLGTGQSPYQWQFHERFASFGKRRMMFPEHNGEKLAITAAQFFDYAYTAGYEDGERSQVTKNMTD